MNKGRIIKVSGSVVDVEFPDEHIPGIKEELEADTGRHRKIMEVAQHIGKGRVRCIMLSPSEGLYRGMEVRALGHEIEVPVGRETLGRMFNVLGETIDGGPAIPGSVKRWGIHHHAPGFADQSPSVEILETGILMSVPL